MYVLLCQKLPKESGSQDNGFIKYCVKMGFPQSTAFKKIDMSALYVVLPANTDSVVKHAKRNGNKSQLNVQDVVSFFLGTAANCCITTNITVLLYSAVDIA